jgi:uncharacterized repeat protein (TIGR01451 family)
MAPASPVAVGVASAYTYTVSNKGPFDATGVHVRLQLPSAAKSVSAAASGGSCTLAAAIATCSFDVLRANGSAAITLNATAPAAGSFQVVGTVAGDQPDSDATNNAVTSTATVAPPPSVAPPPTVVATGKSGGGSLSPWDVPGLSLLLALQVMARQRRAARRATPRGARASAVRPPRRRIP